MTKVICTTTINPPTEALRKFSEMKGWTLVVAGDKKTPHAEYRDLNCVYLGPEDQENIDQKLSDLICWNCIQRRNFAFLYARKEMNADIIATIDDDNIPLSGWGEELMIGTPTVVRQYITTQEIFDPIYATNWDCLWHRGFPISLIAKRNGDYVQEIISADVQADFWSGDPDVDAICRMEHNPDCEFEDYYFPLTSNKPSPFNSQNTFLSRKVMPHYFMHLDVGRWDDIVASYYVQALGFKVAYGKPSVIQKRNEHDVMEDFKREVWGYQNTLPLVRDLAKDQGNLFDYLTPRAAQAFRQYQSHFE